MTTRYNYARVTVADNECVNTRLIKPLVVSPHFKVDVPNSHICTAAVADDCVEVTLRVAKNCEYDTITTDNKAGREMDNYSAPRHMPSEVDKEMYKKIEAHQMGDYFAPAHTPSAAKNYECDIDIVETDKGEHAHPPSIPGELALTFTKDTQQSRSFSQESASTTGLLVFNRMQELEDIERALRGIAKAKRAIDLHLLKSSTFNDHTHSASSRTGTTATSNRSTSIRRLRSIPLTIFTLPEVSLSTTEKAGQRLYNKQTIEIQPKLVQEQLEATTKRKPKEQKKVNSRKTLPRQNASTAKVVSGNSKISHKRDLYLVDTSDVLGFYHSMYAQSHIQNMSEECTSNKRLHSVNKEVIKCLDQLTKMEMKTGNGHRGKFYRCKFTEAAEKWSAVKRK